MSTFTRNIIGIVLLIGLSFMVGCSAMQSGDGQSTAMSNLFPWSKPKPTKIKTVEDFIAQPRPKWTLR